ncbi:MAG: hypothetical protein ABSE59_03730 [Opitutaceae bacterium]|jgi:hypothetical protein
MASLAKASTGVPPGRGERLIWLAAGLGALAAAALVLWLFSRAPALPPAAAPPRPAPAVGLTRLDNGTADAVTREQAELLDPTPLFLPTGLNAQPRRLPDGAAREPEVAFAAFVPRLLFDENALALKFPAIVAVPARPIEALTVGVSPRPVLGFGRVDLAVEPLSAQGGFAEVSAAATGQTVLAQSLTEAAPPAAGWAPLEFLVTVNSMGLVGPPELTRSSGNDSVDAYFRDFLADKIRLGARLQPGLFCVKIGP